MHAADRAIESGMVSTANLDLLPAMMTIDIGYIYHQFAKDISAS
jgi:hypothetical protein